MDSVLDKALKALHANGVADVPLPELTEELPVEFVEPTVAPEPVKPTAKLLPIAPAAGLNFELRPIPHDQIDEYWPRVEEGIKEIVFRSKGFYKFTSQEVWAFCHRKIAHLWVGFLAGEYAGFGILRYDMTDDWTKEPYLLSWIGHSLSPVAKECYYRDLETIARANNMKEIRHYSPRLGFDRKPPRDGWITAEICQIKRLD